MAPRVHPLLDAPDGLYILHLDYEDGGWQEEEYEHFEDMDARIRQLLSGPRRRWPQIWVMRPGDNGLMWRVRRTRPQEG